jgi:hypothetical protein
MIMTKFFTNAKKISGATGAFDSSLVPLSILRELKRNMPIPITMTTTTFVINASVTNHVPFVVGNDYTVLRETLTYTWTAATNTILNSAGVVTASQSPALGAWYFYLGISDTGTHLLYPSQSAPSMVEGPFGNGHFTHPGTTRSRAWTYVGFQVNDDATAPTFVAMTKTGFTYNTTDTSVATGTAWAELAFTNAKALPKHGALGLTVSGNIETGIGGTVLVGNASVSTKGFLKVDPGDSVTIATFTPFHNITPTSNGKIYAMDTAARGDVHVTQIHDVV